MATKYGTSAGEYIYGTSGNDFLYGLGGNDKIYGGDSRDYISGGDGSDRIVGEGGNDILSGGDGYDRFVFGLQHAADIIEDLDGDHDLLDLTGGIDHYFVGTEESTGYVRIVSVDLKDATIPTDDTKEGSIVLSGVTVDEWKSWGGAYGDPGGYQVGYIAPGFESALVI